MWKIFLCYIGLGYGITGKSNYQIKKIIRFLSHTFCNGYSSKYYISGRGGMPLIFKPPNYGNNILKPVTTQKSLVPWNTPLPKKIGITCTPLTYVKCLLEEPYSRKKSYNFSCSIVQLFYLLKWHWGKWSAIYFSGNVDLWPCREDLC